MDKRLAKYVFHSTGVVSLHLWIFRLIIFFRIRFLTLSTTLFQKQEKGSKNWRSPLLSSWLTFTVLIMSINIPPFNWFFQPLWVLVYEDCGVSFIPVHVCICLGVMKKREAAGIWISRLSQPVQHGRGDFSDLYTWSPCNGSPATRTSALKRCCHYPLPACPARFGIDWIWRVQDSEAGDAAARFLWKQKWEMRGN